MNFRVVPLGPDTWPAFAELVERNNGVYGGCWCIGYHPEVRQASDHRQTKRDRVMSGAAHAALVVDEDGVAVLVQRDLELCEDNGFRSIRQVGKHAWIVSRKVPARGSAAVGAHSR